MRAAPPIAAPAMRPTDTDAGLVGIVEFADGDDGGDGSVASGTAGARVLVADS